MLRRACSRRWTGCGAIARRPTASWLPTIGSEIERYIRGLRDTEMPAMSHALEILPAIGFAQQQILLPEFDRLFKALTRQQKEFWEEMGKPKAARRTALGKEYFDTATALIDVIDKISGVL